MATSRPRGFAQAILVAGTATVLGTLAIYGTRSWVIVCHNSEALSMLQNVRGAEEALRAETTMYGGCTASGLQTTDGALEDAALYPRPRAKLDERKVQWTQGAKTPVGACFIERLEVRSDGPVRFSYAVAAQNGHGEPAYQIIAVGDPDGDGELETYRTSSTTLEVEPWPDP